MSTRFRWEPTVPQPVPGSGPVMGGGSGPLNFPESRCYRSQ
jgi:hypothetical protein